MRQESIGTRLGTARRALGLTVEQVNAKTGIPISTLKKYESGRSTPGGDAIQSATKLGLNAHWLVTGEGPMLMGTTFSVDENLRLVIDHALLDIAGESGADVGMDECEVHLPEDAADRLLQRISPFLPSGEISVHPDEFATLPLYNVEACAGDGSYVEHEQVATHLSFRRDWIHSQIHANPANLHLIYVRGDSMEPDLHDGEIVMVDTSFANRVPRDGIYVVQIDHQVAVKRLQRLPGDQVKVMSSNRAYEPFTAHLGDGELKVIGKVIWHAGPMG